MNNFLRSLGIYLKGHDQSFGVVPTYRGKRGCRFLLIKHKKGHWSFPKGHSEKGETAFQAALRELVEETGVEATLDDQIYEEEKYYLPVFGKNVPKRVRYYLGWIKNQKVKIGEDEVVAYRWVDYESALKLLTFKGARKVLRNIYGKIDTKII